jgi:hypothetical protein
LRRSSNGGANGGGAISETMDCPDQDGPKTS